MTTLADLITPKTAEQHEAALLAAATAANLPATSWQSGSVPLTLIKGSATAHADADALVAEVAKGGHLDTAEKAWLTLHAKGRFGLDRVAATFAEHDVTLTAAIGAGPHTIAAGQLRFASASGKLFSNKAAGTLSLGGTLTMRVKAESPGSSYNVGAGAISTMLTPLPGVTCANAAGPQVQGRDEETDEALRRRCRDRWATLGRGATEAAYRYWALSASAAVARVAVRAAGAIPGTVQVLIAGPSSAVTEATRQAVDIYIRERKPFVDGLEVYAAANFNVSVAGIVYATDPAAAQAGVEANLLALQGELPLGGKVYRAEIIQRIMDAPGVVNFVPTAPVVDVQLTPSQVAVLVSSLTYEVA
jgi:uncharacterized phage protein gp47/JayE